MYTGNKDFDDTSDMLAVVKKVQESCGYRWSQ